MIIRVGSHGRGIGMPIAQLATIVLLAAAGFATALAVVPRRTVTVPAAPAQRGAAASPSVAAVAAPKALPPLARSHRRHPRSAQGRHAIAGAGTSPRTAPAYSQGSTGSTKTSATTTPTTTKTSTQALPPPGEQHPSGNSQTGTEVTQ
jgi:hypothetical protein